MAGTSPAMTNHVQLDSAISSPILNHMVYYSPATLDHTFAALADPTRRALLARLSEADSLSVSDLAGPLPMSLPAVMKHLAVLSDAERSLKVGISSAYLIPMVSICDPELTLSCPAGLTAIAGADALTHALEAFTAIRRDPVPGIAQQRVFVGKNALSDHFALSAIGLLWQGLETACKDGTDQAAREKVMLGATLAGLAFGVAGTAAAHAIQYPVGAVTHTAHGLGVACLMPYVMTWNEPAIRPELAQIANAAGLGSPDDVIPALAALFARIGIPATLRDLGLTDDRIEWVAEQSSGITRLIQNNPRPLNPQEMRNLVTAAHYGDRASLI